VAVALGAAPRFVREVLRGISPALRMRSPADCCIPCGRPHSGPAAL